jgi:hypothetical protein
VPCPCLARLCRYDHVSMSSVQRHASRCPISCDADLPTQADAMDTAHRHGCPARNWLRREGRCISNHPTQPRATIRHQERLHFAEERLSHPSRRGAPARHRPPDATPWLGHACARNRRGAAPHAVPARPPGHRHAPPGMCTAPDSTWPRATARSIGWAVPSGGPGRGQPGHARPRGEVADLFRL